MVKNLLQCRRPRFNTWLGRTPWRGERPPTPVFLPGEFHGWGYWWAINPWGHKESDMTERRTLSLDNQTIFIEYNMSFSFTAFKYDIYHVRIFTIYILVIISRTRLHNNRYNILLFYFYDFFHFFNAWVNKNATKLSPGYICKIKILYYVQFPSVFHKFFFYSQFIKHKWLFKVLLRYNSLTIKFILLKCKI